jgi:ATP-binding cassette subfamily F protein 3
MGIAAAIGEYCAMSLISGRGLSKSYGAVTVFTGVTCRIPPDARIALVGPNGVGKTTLLRILAGFEEPSGGTIQRAKELRFGYLAQEAAAGVSGTLWSSCLEPFAHLREREAELTRLEHDLSRSPHDPGLLERCGELRCAFDDAGGYTYETRIGRTLGGLGFREVDFAMPLEKLSGGQQTRARLARLLLDAPGLLMLDEPTNHLDIAAVEWLEECLRTWQGAVLIVSHDRYFLDRVVDHVWEMRSFGLEMFRGNYSAYVQQREARWADRARYVAAEKERLEKELDFIQRNMAGQLSVQAKGRLRRVSRMIRAIEEHGFEGVRGRKWIEIGSSELTLRPDEAARRLRALGGTDREAGTMRPAIHPRRRGGNIILRACDLEAGYPGRVLFRVEKLLLQRRQRVAIIGGNGSAASCGWARTSSRATSPRRTRTSIRRGP